MPPATRDAWLQELDQLLNRLSCRLRRGSRDDSGLTFAQFHLLRRLEGKAATVSELADDLGVSLSSVTGLTDRLVKCELVTRERGRGDRRVVHVAITRRGTELLTRIQIRRRELLAEYFKELTDTEVQETIRLLRTAGPREG